MSESLLIDYSQIEKVTSKKFVNFIQIQLSSNTKWKHFEIREDEKFYTIDAIDCYIERPTTTYDAYHFIFNKQNNEFFKTSLGTHWIKSMYKKGWIDVSE